MVSGSENICARGFVLWNAYLVSMHNCKNNPSTCRISERARGIGIPNYFEISIMGSKADAGEGGCPLLSLNGALAKQVKSIH